MAAFSCLSSLANGSEIRSLTMADMPPTFMEENEFSFVSFYSKSNPESAEIDSFVEGAKAFLDQKVESGEWASRSVGWFRCDLDEHPEMAIDSSGRPDMMMAGK